MISESLPLKIALIGPEEAGKTIFLATLIKTLHDLQDPIPSKIKAFVSHPETVLLPEQARMQYENFKEDKTLLTKTFTAKTPYLFFNYHKYLVQCVDTSAEDWEHFSFFLQQTIEEADALFILVPLEFMQKNTAQIKAKEKFEAQLTRLLEKVKQWRGKRKPKLFFFLSKADLSHEKDLSSPENHFENISILKEWTKIFAIKYYFFSAREDFVYGQGIRSLDHARVAFENIFHQFRKQRIAANFWKTLKIGIAFLALFMLYQFMLSFSWKLKIEQAIQQSKLDLKVVHLESAQQHYQKQIQLLSQLEYSPSFLNLFSIVPDQSLRNLLNQFKKKLHKNLTHLPAYAESPAQLNYRPEDYEQAIQWIRVLSYNSSGDPYGENLLVKKEEASRLKEKLPDVRAWGRLYKNGQELLVKAPSNDLKKFIETVLLHELTWTLENAWDRFLQMKPTSNRFFQRCYRFLETNEDFIPFALKEKFNQQLEVSWNQAFTELKEKVDAETVFSKRFALLEKLYRDSEGNVIPEADKHMPAAVRLKLKQEMVSLLNAWPNEVAESSWDSWFGGRVERKLEQIRLFYAERENINSPEEWGRFLSSLNELTMRLHSEIQEENEIKLQLEKMQQFIAELKKEQTLTVSYQLTLSDDYKSYLNSFVPKVSLLVQKENEEKEFVLSDSEEEHNVPWSPGELLRIKVEDQKYPYYDPLQIEAPSFNPFVLYKVKRYSQSETVYLDMEFKFEATLIDLGKAVDSYWIK